MADAAYDPVRARMMSLRNEELRRVVTVDADDRRPAVRQVAQQEIERRAIVSTGARNAARRVSG